MESIRHNPSVFVSSTCYDLKQVREDLKDFFEENYGFQTILSEFDSFPVDPCKGTFENCIENVDNTADKDKSVFHADEATNANYAERAATAVSATIAADSNAWCGYKLHAPMTKAEYDALTTKDSMTYYPIIG